MYINAKYRSNKKRNNKYELVMAVLVISARVVTKYAHHAVGGLGVNLDVVLRFLILPRGFRICESHLFAFKSHLFGLKSHLFGLKSHLFAFFCI